MPIPVVQSDCPPGLEYLTQIDQLLIKQQVELLEGKLLLSIHIKTHRLFHSHLQESCNKVVVNPISTHTACCQLLCQISNKSLSPSYKGSELLEQFVAFFRGNVGGGGGSRYFFKTGKVWDVKVCQKAKDGRESSLTLINFNQ